MENKVKWLLEPEVFQHDGQSLVDALSKKNIEHKVCQFGTTYDDLVRKAFSEEDCVVVYGSLQLGRAVQRKTKWVPGVYCNLPKLECLYYYPRFGASLVNSDYVMLPFGELKNRKARLFHDFGVVSQGSDNGCIFLRPNSGFKTFTGQIVEYVEWERELRNLSFKVEPESLVLVCRPIEITREWRLVVTNKVIAASQYKQGSGLVRITGKDICKSRNVPSEVIKYGQQILDEVKFRPDPIWTMDICETAGKGLKVLEVGSFSCAGLYDCDPYPIIEEVNRLALQEWQEIYGK